MKNTKQQSGFQLFQMNQSNIDQNYLTIGRALFPKDLHSKLREKFQKPVNREKLSKIHWRVSKSTLELWLKFLEHMKCSNCEEFYGVSLQNPEILTILGHISFRNLIILSLGQNKIRSIEAIIFLDMRQIQSIILNENQITNTKPLQKLAWPRLQQFYLAINPIINLRFERTKLLPEANGTTMSFEVFENSNCFNQDFGFLAKTEIKSIHFILLSSASRIQQHLRKQAIERKLLQTNFRDNFYF